MVNKEEFRKKIEDLIGKDAVDEESVQKIVGYKEKGYDIEAVKLGSTTFIYRSLNRKEWRSLQKDVLKEATDADGNIDTAKLLEAKDTTEENLVMAALLWPKVETKAQLVTNFPAGHITTLAEKITQLCGYTREEEEVKSIRL